MAINKGYLIAKTDKESGEMYTPFQAEALHLYFPCCSVCFVGFRSGIVEKFI